MGTDDEDENEYTQKERLESLKHFYINIVSFKDAE